MENNDLVSCVIPSYKRAETLRRAINSVLAQTYSHIEVIVVDDNIANDEFSKALHSVLNEYKGDDRVRLVTQPQHINGAEARNAGIRAAQGEYIAFLDDDDEWLPGKVEKQMEILNKHPEIDGVSSLYNEYTAGRLFHSCPPYNAEGLHKKIFQREVAVFTSTILLRRKALLEAGLFDNTLKRHQDLQLLLDFTKAHKMYALNEYLVKLHSDSTINRPSYERLVNIKRDFFHAVASHLEMYTPKEQRQIKAAHSFELAFAALKEKNVTAAIKHILSVGINISAYKSLMKRMKDRKYIIES